MPDGVLLLADRYYPRGAARPPAVLIRCPYGRRGINALTAGLLTERGFQVLLQSCRGTFGSGGSFTPFFEERADGLATLEWMRKQEWFSGEFALLGASYVGYTVWAIAGEAGPGLKAISAHVTTSDFRRMIYTGGSFNLSVCLTWNNIMNTQESSGIRRLAGLFSGRKFNSACEILPVCNADEFLIGGKVPFWRDILEHAETGDPWWQSADHSRMLSAVAAPVNFIGGWYDIFLPYMLQDYADLKSSGWTPYLTVGPWTHMNPGMQLGSSMREAVAWLRANLLEDRTFLRKNPVRLYVMGAGEWREYPEWPPPGYSPRPWYLQAGHGFGVELPGDSTPDYYLYDPARPTPFTGGPVMNHEAGPKDNRKIEARPDVLVYTGEIIEKDLEIIGSVRAVLYVRSSLQNSDFFVRLCDVHPSGKSINVCDGIRRLKPGNPAAQIDGTIRVEIDLWPVAFVFKRGHRVRLQVSSGAHPRFARNLGSGEGLGAGTSLRAAEQTVYHDFCHPSHILFPEKSSGG